MAVVPPEFGPDSGGRIKVKSKLVLAVHQLLINILRQNLWLIVKHKAFLLFWTYPMTNINEGV